MEAAGGLRVRLVAILVMSSLLLSPPLLVPCVLAAGSSSGGGSRGREMKHNGHLLTMAARYTTLLNPLEEAKMKSSLAIDQNLSIESIEKSQEQFFFFFFWGGGGAMAWLSELVGLLRIHSPSVDMRTWADRHGVCILSQYVHIARRVQNYRIVSRSTYVLYSSTKTIRPQSSSVNNMAEKCYFLQ
uniref:Uncharacterized protein n=1 Tax=Oryza nivara TaxID=4536 RepID=A0A0E0G3L0_ORYNI